jgi:hypothetical protein
MKKTLLLGVLGLVLAVGVGLAANAISRDSIGLASAPAGSGIELSPARTTGAASAAKPGGGVAPRSKATKRKVPSRPGSVTTTPARTTTSTTGAPTSTDDHGGRSRGGSGGGGSGSGGGGGGGGSGGGHGGGDD